MSSSLSSVAASAAFSEASEASRSAKKRKRSTRSSVSGGAAERGDDATALPSNVRSSRLVVPSSSSSPIEEDLLRGRPLAPNTLSYFRAIQSKIEAFDDQQRGHREAESDEDEVSLLVSAAFVELKGVEYRLLVNRHGSRAVESLIGRGTEEQLMSLLSALLPTSFFLFTDRNASRTLERLLHRLPPLLIKEAAVRPPHSAEEEETNSSPSSVTGVLTALCKFFSSPPSTSALAGSTFSSPPSSHWPLLLCNDSSSHLLRSLFLLVTGHVDLPPLLQHFTSSSSSVASSSSPLPLSVPISRSPAPSSVSPQLDFALTDVVTSVVELKEADRVELAYHSSASPTLQCLIAALASHSTYSTELQRLLAALLLIDDSSSSEPEFAISVQLSASSVSHIQQLSLDRVGSHLMEAVLPVSAVMAMDVFESVVSCWLEEQRLHELSLHSLGNHVVQRLLSALSSSRHRKLLQRCLKRLRPHFRTYIDGGRLGVVWRCLQAAGWVSDRSRSSLLDSLHQALDCKDATDLLPCLLTVNTKQVGQGSSEGLESSSSSNAATVSYFGSVMLQALLSLPSSTPLVSAILALPSDAFLHLASDPRGVHVLESVLVVGHPTGFSHSLTHQHALVDLIIVHLLPLSHSVSGSFLVEKAYRAADSQRKRTISSHLASQQKSLQRSKSGQALLRTCGLQTGKPSVDRWAAEEGRRRKAALFADILGDQ